MEGDDDVNKNDLSIKVSRCSSDHPVDDTTNLNAVLVWERLSSGYRIVDLRENRFEEALELVKDQFLALEPMCRATNLTKDKTSMRTYLDLITAWINEMRSLCAIHEGTGKLVGIAVTTLNRKADQPRGSTRIRMSQGEAIFKIMTLKSCVFGIARLYDKYGINEYFRLHVLCVDREFQNKGIGTALVRSCIDCYRRLHLPACIGAFSSGAAQTITERLGFEILAEIPYREYITPGNKEKPFIDAGLGNYSIACMGLRKLVPATSSRSTSMTISVTSMSKTKRIKKPNET